MLILTAFTPRADAPLRPTHVCYIAVVSYGVPAWPAGRPREYQHGLLVVPAQRASTHAPVKTSHSVPSVPQHNTDHGHKSKSPCRNCSTDSDSVCMTPHSIAPHTQHTSRDAQTDHCGNASHTTCSHNSHNNKRVNSPRHPLLQEDHHP